MRDRRRYRGARVKLSGTFHTGVSVEKGNELLVKVTARFGELTEGLSWFNKLKDFKEWDIKFEEIRRVDKLLHRQRINDMAYLGTFRNEHDVTVSNILSKHYSELYGGTVGEDVLSFFKQSATHGIEQFIKDTSCVLKMPIAYEELVRSYYLSRIVDNSATNPFTLLDKIPNSFSLNEYHEIKTLKHRLQLLSEGRLDNLLVDVAMIEKLEGWNNGNNSI